MSNLQKGEDCLKIRRTVKIKAFGMKISTFITMLRSSGVVCSSQRCSSGEFSAYIYLSDLEKAEDIAEKTGVTLYNDGTCGGMYTVMRYRARYGLIAGVLITAAFIFLTTAFVMKIEVNGCVSISEKAVLNILDESGISHGKFIPGIDFNRAEYSLKSGINKISWAAIRSRGGRVIVDINEDSENGGSVQSGLPCNIVSDRDALIVSVSPFRGQCKVRAGDVVTAGEILISGIITNEKNNFVVERAQGEITGEYVLNQKFVRYFENTEKVYIKTEYRKYLDFFGFRIPLSFCKPDGENYDKSEFTDYYDFFGYEIPVGTVTEKYDIYEYSEVTETEEEAEMNLNLMIVNFEKNFLKDTEITSCRKDRKVYDDRVECSVMYTVRGSIGEEKIIFPGKNGEDK